MKKVFFPGSFNPFTKGHADIVERMLTLADEVVIGIGCNIDKPVDRDEMEKRASAIREYYNRSAFAERVKVIWYTELTMQAAKNIGADCVVRGVRSAMDFDYEYGLAAANREVFGIETILLPADPSLGFISSTVVRDLMKHGDTVNASKFLPS